MGLGLDLTARVGSISLPNPVMTASGTGGHGAELARFMDLGALGAVVVKSLSVDPCAGNAPPRLAQTTVGMINSVGLEGPGIAAWLTEDLPALAATGARVVVSIWGRTIEDFAMAATMLAGAPSAVVAIEVNISCPNLADNHRMFSQSASATAQVIEATRSAGLPRWAKLSPNVTDLVEVAGAALEAGAEALTLTNTMPGLVIDTESRSPVLGGGGGGLSGPALHPIAVRAVYQCRAAFPRAAIVGVGGVARGSDAVEMALAGASAVQVGTASFSDPRAAARVLAGIEQWCLDHRIVRWADLTGGAHG
ncbi:MAG: dihydroorotate dehydrogenase [Acidimicrobiales bacterium]